MTDPDYFALVELRALPQMGDATKYGDDRCLAAAAYVTGIVEREVGTAFVTRTVTAEIHDGGTTELVLEQPYARAVTAMTVDGTSLDVSELVVQDGIVRRVVGGVAESFASGVGNVSVTYTYCYSTTPPADLKEAALKGTRAHLLATDSNSAIDDRRTSMTNELGTISYVVAGEDRPTGYPEVDATIVAWRDRLDVFGFA